MKNEISSMGRRITYARELKNISQGDLSRKTDISKGTISMVERDITDLTSSHLALICKELGVSSDFVLFGETQNRGDEWSKLSGTKDGIGLKQTVLDLWKSETLRPLFLKLGKMSPKQLTLISTMIDAILAQTKIMIWINAILPR